MRYCNKFTKWIDSRNKKFASCDKNIRISEVTPRVVNVKTIE